MGIRSPVNRSTLADANERRDWRNYADFRHVYSAPGAGSRLRPDGSTVRILQSEKLSCSSAPYSLQRSRDGKNVGVPDQSVRTSAGNHLRTLQSPWACRAVFQVGQTETGFANLWRARLWILMLTKFSNLVAANFPRSAFLHERSSPLLSVVLRHVLHWELTENKSMQNWPSACLISVVLKQNALYPSYTGLGYNSREYICKKN